jgi:hypothetical protein
MTDPDTQNKEQEPRKRISAQSQDPDLRYKFWHLFAQYSSLTIAVIGFFGLWFSVNSNTKSVRANVQSSMLTQVTALDSVFLAHPDFYPYFYEGRQPPVRTGCYRVDAASKPKAMVNRQPVEVTEPCYQDLYVAAMRVADVLDIVGVQNIRFKNEWENPEAWDKWTFDQLKCGPILLEFLNDHRDWYGTGLIEKRDKVERERMKCPHARI